MQLMTDSDWIEIDGSKGEGGGQMVRSSLGLSIVTGRRVRISNVRAGRAKPGLMRQHLTAVRAAAEVCDAKVTGDEIGSSSISFEPRPFRPGKYHFKIGTAGSASLVLQTILPALLIADEATEVTIEGGTHNDKAPPFEFLERAYAPLVRRMGPRIELTLERFGFFPAGGGVLHARITPVTVLKGYDILDRGDITQRCVTARVAGLPIHIAEREIDVIRRGLQWSETEAVAETVSAACPGNYLWIEIASPNVTEVVTGFGKNSTRAEIVAREALSEAREYLKSGVPIGIHLADQWMLPLAISAWQAKRHGGMGGGRFKTQPLTLHSTTHLQIIERFLGITSNVELCDGRVQIVTISS